MSVSYTLGISSSDAIAIFPEKSFKNSEKMERIETRVANGDLWDLIKGVYKQIDINVEYFPGSQASIVNSWWESQTKLLFFVTSDTSTAVYSCMIMNETTPLYSQDKPSEQHWKGKISLEGY
jgi:hypothetical protein